MNISVKEIEAVTVVHVEGNLDTKTTPDAKQRFDELISDGSSKFLVDFGALEYISSVGLGLLLSTAKKLRSAGGSLRICGLNDTVRQVFEMSGFSTILQVFEREDEAMAGF